MLLYIFFTTVNSLWVEFQYTKLSSTYRNAGVLRI